MGFFDNLFGGKKKPDGNPQQPASTPGAFVQLTPEEKAICEQNGASADDALFLKTLTKRQIEWLEFDEDAALEKGSGICSLTTEENAKQIVLQNRDRFISQGKYLFICEMAHNGNKVGIVSNTSDPYRVMRFAGTNGINYDIETETIIAKLKEWDSRFGIRVTTIGMDLCEVQIVNKDLDYAELAQEVYEFCPMW